MKISAAVIARNDGYGGNLIQRSTYCLNSLIHTFDEVVFCDWNSPNNRTLIDEIRNDLLKKQKLRVIKVTPEQASKFTNFDPKASPCCEVLARNIAIRRCSGDYIISTNIDIVVTERRKLRELELQDKTFYTIPRRHIDLNHLIKFNPTDVSCIQDFLYLNREQYWQHKLGGAGAYPGDIWSKVCCCGDFQIAHRNIWHTIRGFEESMIYRNFADTNVQKKAALHGFNLEAKTDYDVFHINHGSHSTPMHGNCAFKTVRDFTQTTNSENWGFSNIPFAEEII
jgi:hypothetical protein